MSNSFKHPQQPRFIGALKDGQHFKANHFSEIITLMLANHPVSPELCPILDHYRQTIPGFNHFKSSPDLIYALLRAKNQRHTKSMSEYNRAMIILDEQYQKEAYEHDPFTNHIPNFFQYYNDSYNHIH